MEDKLKIYAKYGVIVLCAGLTIYGVITGAISYDKIVDLLGDLVK